MPPKLQFRTYLINTSLPLTNSSLSRWIPTLGNYARKSITSTWNSQRKYLIVSDESTNIQKNHCNRTSARRHHRITNVHNHGYGWLNRYCSQYYLLHPTYPRRDPQIMPHWIWAKAHRKCTGWMKKWITALKGKPQEDQTPRQNRFCKKVYACTKI